MVPDDDDGDDKSDAGAAVDVESDDGRFEDADDEEDTGDTEAMSADGPPRARVDANGGVLVCAISASECATAAAH